MNIKFFDYCIIVFGDTADISIDLEAISEGNIHYLDIDSVYVATFCSAMKVGELKEFFSSMGRNFVLSLTDNTTFGSHLEDERSFKHLFTKRDYFKIDHEELRKQLNNIGKSIKDEEQELFIGKQEIIKPSLDELLDKINIKGLKSLSIKEKKYLDEYSS